MSRDPGAPEPHSVQQALRPLHFALMAATLFSLGINLMMLVSPIYLMQVFDRVLSSGSLDTLLWLSIVAVACLAVYGALDAVRGRILSKMGLWLESELTGRLIRAGVSRLRAGDGTGSHALRDLAQVRGFLSGPAVHTLFDAPWAMLFLAVLWLLHPWYGIFAMASMTVLLIVAATGDALTRTLSRRASEKQVEAISGAEVALRNADVVHAMGMTGSLLGRWGRSQSEACERQNSVNDRAAALTGLSKFIRITVQTAIIGIGAILVLRGEATAGGMIAASVLLGRALAPVDQAIASWNQLTSVRAAWRRVNEALHAAPAQPPRTSLPEPRGHLAVENVTMRFPGLTRPVLDDISFELQPGESMAIVGPSAAGKSLLCKVLCGVVTPTGGHVRIDDAELKAWPDADLRPHLGYLPQEVGLFPGTVADNIARLSGAAPEDIIAAAKLADVHELVLRLPDGYETDVGAFGHLLSGGQRQRIGLARAVFGEPKLVILDEPNSNLDPAGEAALVQALAELKKRGCTVVIVSHKLGIVQSLDKTLLLQDGAVRAIGPSDKVLSILMATPAHKRPTATPAPSSTSSVS